MTYDELFEAIENKGENGRYKTAADLLMTAINDWPTFVKEPSELIDELRTEIKDNLTFENLHKYLQIRPEKDAWKRKALTALLKLFDFEKNMNSERTMELETIILRITQHYRQNK